MGYITEFEGKVSIVPALNHDEVAMLNDLYDQRGGNGMPDSYCQWVPSDDGSSLAWDGGDTFYLAEEWMIYIVNLLSANHTCNGTILADGEERGDVWKLIVKDNVVSRMEGL